MQAFDDLLLLKRGGFATYVGHLGTHSVDLVNYFQVCAPFSCARDMTYVSPVTDVNT